MYVVLTHIYANLQANNVRFLLDNSLLLLGIFTKVNQQTNPSAPPVPQPDNAEEELNLLKSQVSIYTYIKSLFVLCACPIIPPEPLDLLEKTF